MAVTQTNPGRHAGRTVREAIGTVITISPSTSAGPVRPVTVDLYRDIHKAIRAELFAVTEEAGRVDASQGGDRAALADHVRSVVWLLTSHAEHEDGAIQPVLEQRLPDLARRVAADHDAIERRMDVLAELATTVVEADTTGARAAVHALYGELASFTAAYLDHQDVEERVVMPTLEAEIGVEAAVGIHQAIIGSIPPDEMARSLALMLPAMNIDDRAELLGGMRAGAPEEVFHAVWSLAGSVLTPADHAALAQRLGLG
jgi:hypothetical protein